ncbi:MAG: hypothetical protein WBG11_08675 [Methylocella sp.]
MELRSRVSPSRTDGCAGVLGRFAVMLTPGATRTTSVADVCGDRSTRQFRHWSRARDNRILAEYGLPAGPHPDFEVDHLIPLDLGGADDDRNLWPEPRRSIEPEWIEPEWNAERKDRLEWKLADLSLLREARPRGGARCDSRGLDRCVAGVFPAMNARGHALLLTRCLPQAKAHVRVLIVTY